MNFVILTASTVATFISVLSYALLIRVLLQFFASEDSKAYEFCYAVTEPVVSPVRNALGRVSALADSPLDFSYLATFIILSITRILLPSPSVLS